MTGDTHGLPGRERSVGLGEKTVTGLLELSDLVRIAFGILSCAERLDLLLDLQHGFFEVERQHVFLRPSGAHYKVAGHRVERRSGNYLPRVDSSNVMKEPEAMSQEFKLAFIGCGNMGGAILDGLLESADADPKDILVVERSTLIRERCRERGIRATDRMSEVGAARTLLLAVKPQGFAEAAAELGSVPGDALVISVMAGISSLKIRTALGGAPRVVRAMPNTPSRIHSGITAIAAGAGAVADDLRIAEEIMSTVGEVVRVREDEMHVVTAVSGSGPAYVFLLAEAWIDAAIAHGLEHETAIRLVKATLLGAARLADKDVAPAELRAAVTSKGGTTAAGIAALEERAFRLAMKDAIAAATRRGQELDSEVPS